MGLEALARSLLIIISLGIFCYQMQSAVNKLISPPAVDTSTFVPMTELNVKPLVTMCLDNQPYFKYLGVENAAAFFQGIINDGNVTWEIENMTFHEIIKYLSKKDETLFEDFSGSANLGESSYVYPIGNCKNVEFQPEMMFMFTFDQPTYTVHITDPSQATYFSLGMNSHIGSKIVVDDDDTNDYFYAVQTKIRNLNNPQEKYLCNPTEDYAFRKCVDDFIQDQLSQDVGCVPPFLSDTNSCTTITANKNNTYFLRNDLRSDYILRLDSFKDTLAEQSCLKNCWKMENNVQLTHRKTSGEGSITIRFDPMVEVTSKVIVYGWFEFIIDAGSSLGLWLGLSALGIWDLAVEYLAKFSKVLSN